MENKLIAYFSKFSTFSESELQALKDSMVIKSYEKGSFLSKEGQANTSTYFVLSGLVRQYRLIDGEEVTTGFYTEGQWIISLTGFTEDTIASDYLVCDEETSVVIGNEEKAQKLFHDFPRFETISRAVMETVFAEQHKTMTHHLRASPEEKYVRLLETRPDLAQRVPQYQLASYIGVKPESLSRIRKRMAQK
jgi:CRP-like cAMP-binding protein